MGHQICVSIFIVGPLELVDVRAKKATVTWQKPEDDGGTPISHYVLEKMDVVS